MIILPLGVLPRDPPSSCGPRKGSDRFAISLFLAKTGEVAVSNEDALQKGIELAQQGDFKGASTYFASVVQSDPASEDGWFWLGLCCFDPKQREYCFRRVLTLNPGHEEAREQLNILVPPAPPPATPQGGPVVPPAEPPSLQEPPHPQAVSPFIFDDQTAEANPGSLSTQPELTPFLDFPITTQPPPSTPTAPAAPPVSVPSSGAAAAPPRTPPPAAPAVARPVRKEPNWAAIILVFLITILILCGLGVGYLYMSGRLAGISLLGFAGPSSPVVLQNTPAGPASAATATQTPLPPTATIQPATDTPTLIPTPKPTIAYTPVYTSNPCAFEAPKEVVVNCGFVTVPEDRTDPNSAKIQLAVVVYHSLNPKPAPDPVIFLQGGPGAGAVQLSADAYDLLVRPFLDKRDFITFDQRGTGYSKPALGCKELTSAYTQDIHGQIPADSRNLIYSSALLSCHDAMSIKGINLSAYTTLASAADLRDIMTVLGYKQVDLYGASYGTRLAQVVMREDPDIVRSSVVDSVVPVETKIYNEDPAALDSSLRALFDTCASEPACHAAYPDLETVFRKLVTQLNANPVSVKGPIITGGTTTEQVDGSIFENVIVGLLKESLIAPAAQAIYQIKAGDYSVLIAAQYSVPDTFADIAPGLYISMMCHEHILATTPQDLQAALAPYPEYDNFSWLPFYGGVDGLFKTCGVWNAKPPAAGENAPVSSSIPTLIITGKYDPATPPAWAKELATHLSQNYLFIFPDNGHTPTAADSTGCAMSMVVAFLDNPAKSPDHTCLDKMKDVQFIVPYTGTPAVNLTATKGYGFTYKVPSDWLLDPNGFYWRDESPLDITQFGVFTTIFTSSDVLNSLSSKLYDYGGFDAAPIQTGTRVANGLTWDLYETTSYGRPVDLAMTDTGLETMVIMLFCHTDEHQALYQTIYLPVIDSAVPTP